MVHQMTIFRALQHAFNDGHGETLSNIKANMNADPSFGRTVFDQIKAIYRDKNFSSAQRELGELKEAYTKFTGDPVPYFERILHHTNRLSKFCPNYRQPPSNVCHKIINRILLFGSRPEATITDKLCSVHFEDGTSVSEPEGNRGREKAPWQQRTVPDGQRTT
eukprot:1395371-Rhodomonas_salina.2